MWIVFYGISVAFDTVGDVIMIYITQQVQQKLIELT